MLLRFPNPFAKTTGQADEDRDISGDVTEADFIPYAFHYNPRTLITKNGELLQTLRITTDSAGVDHESAEPGAPALRDTLRRVVDEYIHSNRYAYWFHTLRRRYPIAHQPHFAEAEAAGLHQAWQAQHRRRYGYSNEVFVTVLRQGEATDLLDFSQFKRAAMVALHRKHQEALLDEAAHELDTTMDQILSVLQQHSNAQRLEIRRRRNAEGVEGVYSEPLEWVHYLINLMPGEMPIMRADASRQLATHELTFGFDALESRAEDGNRRFAGILTLKGAAELSPQVLDKCLQIPEEMIITQSFNYLPAAQALEKRVEARELIESSPDGVIPLVSGLRDILGSDRGRPTDFGEQHTSIAIVCDRYKDLDAAIGGVQENFAQAGLITVREEIMLEDCFWAQLPGNFPFLRRRTPINAMRMAGLARLNRFPSGRREGSRWGAPVAILPTVQNTPYFFNFHAGETGHTLLLDFNSFADERGVALLNFLLACTRQYNGRLIILDRNQTARPLVAALGGEYHRPLYDTACTVNPLQLPDTPRNRAFLAAWLGQLIYEDATGEQQESIRKAIDAIFALPPNERSFLQLRKIAALPMDAVLEKLFGGESDSLHFAAPVCAVEMGDTVQVKKGAALFAYLLHRIVLTLDGAPTVIVLNEAWDLLDNPFFLPRIESLLDMLQQNNALVIFTTRRLEDHAESHLTRQLVLHTPTKIFVPDDVAVDYRPNATGLTAHEAKTLLRMERQKGHVLIKHGAEVVECMFPAEGLEKYYTMLAGDARALRLMQIQGR